ncbi:MAG: NADH-quinone oxidoreductase subunit J [Marinilabiliales bacterium]|nr:NADH-quinone oxidoreductase subunit J [Marinilabiliales bacterium]
MIFSKYLFFILSFIAIYAALKVLISKKPMHSVLYLTLAFFAIGGHYILLNAQFLAVVHIIVYAGAIMVLFIYTVMLLNLNIKGEFPKSRLAKIVGSLAGGLLLLTLIALFRSFDLQVANDPSLNQIGLVKSLGKVLFDEYYLPFELSSILFLAAMVGAVMLGKKDIY